MGEHIYRLAMGELERIRVRCVACKTTFEMDTRSAGRVKHACPQCNADLFQHDDNPFAELQNALAKIRNLSTLDVEFPILLSPLDGHHS